MKVKELIEKLQKEDQELEVGVRGYDYDIYTPNIEICSISVQESHGNFYWIPVPGRKIVVIK